MQGLLASVGTVILWVEPDVILRATKLPHMAFTLCPKRFFPPLEPNEPPWMTQNGRIHIPPNPSFKRQCNPRAGQGSTLGAWDKCPSLCGSTSFLSEGRGICGVPVSICTASPRPHCVIGYGHRLANWVLAPHLVAGRAEGVFWGILRSRVQRARHPSEASNPSAARRPKASQSKADGGVYPSWGGAMCWGGSVFPCRGFLPRLGPSFCG